MGRIYSFEKLEVWKEARVFTKDIYQLTNQFPTKEQYCLSQQLQRAAVSIVSNLAEGLSRSSHKEQIRFIEISYGSLMEVYCQLLVSFDLGYIKEVELNEIKVKIDQIASKLGALKNYQVKKMNESLNSKL